MSLHPVISPEVIASRIGELKTLVNVKRTELEELTEELEWLEQGQRFYGETQEANTGRPKSKQGSLITSERPPLRQAILTVMNERPNRIWAAERIISELARRDWLSNSKNAEHTTRSMMANMNKRGQLKRVDRGKYRLPPEEDDA